MPLKTVIAVVMLGLAAPALSACAGASPPGPGALTRLSGVWTAQSGNVDVAILACGEAFCGDVVRVHGNVSMAEPGKQAAGAPPTEGMRIFTGLKPTGPSRWKGKIFNREKNQTYDVIVTSLSPAELEVRPYIVLESIGQKQIWKSAPPLEPSAN
jgi:uncharacterized protein (DUF2147 family)